MIMMSGDDRGFRGHCASALTHPATIAAVVVLLLNDALFKSLWPESWVTGKLSDLAWVVFASPLLAFVLSFFLGRRSFTRRTAIIIAYVGLPALYSAFNTFEPVHDRILWGLSLVAGGTAGSPLDPTDSLVIPFGLGIAVWVWRRRPVGPDRLRVRLALLAAGVATFATVATSAVVVDTGIETVGVAGDGAIVASARVYGHPTHYRSTDGGLSWKSHDGIKNVDWGKQEVETRRGTYIVGGPEVLVLTIHGEWKVVFSDEYLQSPPKGWVEPRPWDDNPKQFSIVFDESSGNLVVAMGGQGVAVGSPDGKWSSVAVGKYTPADLSPLKKSREFNLALSVLAIALALSASMTAISLALSRFRIENLLSGFGIVLVALALFIGLPELSEALNLSGEIVGYLLLLLFAAAAAMAMYLTSESKDTFATRGFGLAVASCCTIFSGAFLRSVSAPVDLPAVISNLATATFIVLLALAAMRIPWQLLKHRTAVVSAFAGMNVLVILVFAMREQLGFGLNFARISAVALVALAALALITHLERRSTTIME